jgi:hypothetical protein
MLMVTFESESLGAELRNACWQVARDQLPRGGGRVDASDLDALTEAFVNAAFAIAQRRRSSLETVIQAVRYVADMHAISPLAHDLPWFESMLFCALEFVSAEKKRRAPDPVGHHAGALAGE